MLMSFVLFGCQDRIVCAAFQSTYILDDSTRNAYYSYVWQLDETTRAQYLAGLGGNTEVDSTAIASNPTTDYYAHAGEKVVPWRTPKRSKYGIVKYEPYWLKSYRMRTAPMENVFGPEAPDPEPTDYVASTSPVMDSTSVDSLGVASLDSLNVDLLAIESEPEVEEDEAPKYLYKYDPNDNFNVEQEYYNKYYGTKFIDNRPKRDLSAVQVADSLANTSIPDSAQVKGSGLKGLFKKKKNQTDSTTVIPDPVEEDSGND